MVNQTVAAAQQNARVTSDGSGNFIVAWETTGQDGDGTGIFGRRFNIQGVALDDEFAINSTFAGDQSVPDVAAASDGQFVTIWQDGSQPDRTAIRARPPASCAIEGP